MNLRFALFTLLIVFFAFVPRSWAGDKVYVDPDGVMRWSSTGAEANFFGTNYTVPFAYAFRAIERLGLDYHEVIRQDVYHMARLGLNAFRLHIWDVEISDAQGNLIDNKHLELLDFLVAEVERRGMGVMLTLQTNFGNGYPERNVDTDAFTYHYDKCQVHSTPSAIEAQCRYVSQLMSHVNRYTGVAYAHDECVVGYEINNEPCHSTTPSETLSYIETLYNAMRDADCQRPIFYNVSHNTLHRAAYFASSVEGSTYQWYPSGLVAGHARRGNFLPAFSAYALPFDTLPGFSTKAKIVYEFDPADLATSYQYPAVARAFRSAGMQWMTHFAYDPTCLAAYNTEYQTHYMNMIYTPSKAVSLAIAAMVAREDNRCAAPLALPADSVFGATTVSYRRDLGVYNDGAHFYYTSSTDDAPRNPKQLKQIMGVGTSQVVSYSGLGIYFLDKLADGLWRLEIMPDAVPVADAYEKPSEGRKVVQIAEAENDMAIHLPDLGKEFFLYCISNNNDDLQHEAERADADNLRLKPGVYLLRNTKKKLPADLSCSTLFDGNKRLDEHAYTQPFTADFALAHTANVVWPKGKPMEIECRVTGEVDSVVVYPNLLSFWREKNDAFTMIGTSAYSFAATIDSKHLQGDSFGYYIVAYTPSGVVTYPEGEVGMPLDWDWRGGRGYDVALHSPGPINLITDASCDADIEAYSLPQWKGAHMQSIENMPRAQNALRCHFRPDGERLQYVVRKYVGDIVGTLRSEVKDCESIKVKLAKAENADTINIAVVTDLGITYSAKVAPSGTEETLSVRLDALGQSPTALVPISYPDFMHTHFSSQEAIALDPCDIEFIEISTNAITQNGSIDLIGVFLE